MPKRLKSTLGPVSALCAGLALAACSTASAPTIGSINPFGGNSLSEVDRAFLQAAGSWDTNRDNVVTCNEWKSYQEDLFNGADANHDDSLDANEWPNLVKVDRLFETANLAYYDQNKDGKVSRAEFVEKPNPAFTLIDKSGACKLDGSQIASARSKTEYDVSGSKPASGDPREASGQAGKVANGGMR
ncbi:histidine kinase [Hyphomicrobium methylovorum]|uniref:EF-hand domain-containing protein n=1 Tax=Hyphomicrobium methylovorum TaxID=84 RepID=UPI0015E6AE01|nr:EF-hand domain-containing protein [Hyphomicrobium methylovorum]MBA2126461.1 histidine kinase [Hyphomicrobium methylovorum]